MFKQRLSIPKLNPQSTMSDTVLLLLTLLLTTTASSLEPAELAALAAVRDSLTDMPGSSFFSSWDFTAPDPCSSFSGLSCSLGGVTSLTLGTGLSDCPGLSGSLSPALSNLTRLARLVLFPGLVTGPIPPQLATLTSLQVLSLTRNRLTGPVPPSFSALTNLHTLDLSYNRLSGLVPPRLTGLPRLKVLVLAANRLSGELNAVRSRLFHLDLKSNKLSGVLPRSLPLTLRYLSVADNFMWGPIHVLESLTELMYLDLSMNRFSGSVPLSIFTPPRSSVLLQRNNFTGLVAFHNTNAAATSSSYAQGSVVDLSYNSLTGELSPALAGVETLFLNNNRLTGEVPQEYIDSLIHGTSKTLYLQHNYITGFPLHPRLRLPDSVSLCLSYNCMVPLVRLSACPTNATPQLSRPASQCSSFRNDSSTG